MINTTRNQSSFSKNINRFLSVILCTIFFVFATDSWSGNLVLYGDLTTNDTDQENYDLHGSFDALYAHKIDDSNLMLIEAVAEKSAHGTEVELERWWLKHQFSSQFNLAFGRFHSAIGYWNRAKHHGTILQDTIDRPTFLEFEDKGGFLPMHIVGINASGKWLSKRGNWQYQLNLGNGQLIEKDGNELELETQVDNVFHDEIQIGGRLTYKSNQPNYQFSLFANTQKMVADGRLQQLVNPEGGDTLFKQKIVGLDFVFLHNNFDTKLEYMKISNEALYGSGETSNQHAGYLQLGMPVQRSLKLIYRYESLSGSKVNEFYSLIEINNYHRNLFALRYDINSDLALKLQYSDGTSPYQSESFDLISLQLSYRIDH